MTGRNRASQVLARPRSGPDARDVDSPFPLLVGNSSPASGLDRMERPMRKLAVLALALAAVLLFGAPATATAQPTLTLTRDCSRFPPLHGVSVSLSGFPPNTSFQGSL